MTGPAYAGGMIVEVEREERYWYPDDGGIVWLAGFQPVAPDGRFLARDAPELAAAGLRIAGVAGAARHHADALASDAAAPGQPLELRRDPANPHDPNAIAVHGRRRPGRLGPARARGGDRARARRRRAVLGRRAARAARLAARPAHGADDAARRRPLDRAARALGSRAMEVPDGFAPFEPQGPFLEHIGPILWREDDDGRSSACASPTATPTTAARSRAACSRPSSTSRWAARSRPTPTTTRTAPRSR